MSTFEKNVFINCPFDDKYTLLKPLLFTVLHLGFMPRIALERADCSESRINKILELISQSKYGIHDLSRCVSTKRKEFYRMNMPLELGIDYGCKHLMDGPLSGKKILILEKEQYRFHKAVSDLSGSDIVPHGDHPEKLVVAVRNWFANECGIPKMPPGSKIYSDYLNFMEWLDRTLTNQGFSSVEIERLPVPELMGHMRRWEDWL